MERKFVVFVALAVSVALLAGCGTDVAMKPTVAQDETRVEKPIVSETYPWDNGGKLPEEYSWEEFMALNELEQEAFFEWFDSSAEFEVWMRLVNPEGTNDMETVPVQTEVKETYPWSNGGKRPDEYTWEEFQALNELEQEAFFDWFQSTETFEAWLNHVIQEDSDEGETIPMETEDNVSYPWDDGGKQPDEYTWDEFLALSELEQEAFFDWFGSSAAFDEWYRNANPDVPSNRDPMPTESDGSESYPWEQNGKHPDEYTWEEYQALNEHQQEAFFHWFGSSKAFEDWMNLVKPSETEPT